MTALRVDGADRLWVATQSPGDAPSPRARDDRIYVFERCSEIGDGDLPAPRVPIRLDDQAGKVLTIVEDGAHRLWFGRTGGLLRYDPATGESARVDGGPSERVSLAGRLIRDMAVGPSGEIWALTHASAGASGQVPHSLFRVDPDRLTARQVMLRERVARPGGDASPDRLAVDRSGVLWIGSNGGGVRYADVSSGGFSLFPGQLGGSPGLSSSFVRAVCPGRDGAVWVGTPHGLDRIERAGGQVRYRRIFAGRPGERSAPNVQALREDREGNLWVGTSRGLVVLKPDAGATRVHRHDDADPRSLADDWVQVLHDGPDGKVWIGTLHGLGEFDSARSVSSNHFPDPLDPQSLPSGEINALHSDAGGALWIGTAAGLARLTAGAGGARRIERIASGADALGGATVLSLGETASTPGILWVGTEQRGLCRLAFRDLSVLCFTRRNSAIPDNTVYGILTDRNGRLWMSTKRGLACYDPVQGAFRTFGPERGLQSSEFNARAFALASDGEMLFGGIGGLTSFFPERITDNPFAPSILITAVRALDREVIPTTTALIYRQGMPQRSAEIEYGRRDLTFEYVALHYSHPSDNRYLYRLDRYDAGWQGPVAERSIRYTNLAPGPYTFRVKALSSHGVPSDEEAVFSFVIRPPFYATWWFRALAGLGLLLTLAGAYGLRVRQLRRRQEELEGQVARRTEELREALAALEQQTLKLRELDAAKSKFFANISHEFRTPLTLTLGPLRDVRDGRHGPIPPEARAEIELAIRSANQQLELVDQLLALARLDAGQVEFRPRPLRLDECVRLAAAPFEALARRQRTRFELDLRAGAVHGSFDEEKLERIVGNLLGNALKFTPPGGSVTLRLSGAPDGWALLEVEDTGPGIPARDLPRIFERFYRGEQTGGDVPGTGIGLALVQEYVHLHGGEVRAENLPGCGARFTVRLRTAEPVPGTSIVETGGESEQLFSGPDVSVEEPGGSGRPMVLVVDDHADMRAYLRKHLAPHFQVLEDFRGRPRPGTGARRASRPGRERRDDGGPRRPRPLPGAQVGPGDRLHPGDPAHGEGRPHRPDRGSRGRGRRLPHQAVRSRGTAGPCPQPAPAARAPAGAARRVVRGRRAAGGATAPAAPRSAAGAATRGLPPGAGPAGPGRGFARPGLRRAGPGRPAGDEPGPASPPRPRAGGIDPRRADHPLPAGAGGRDAGPACRQRRGGRLRRRLQEPLALRPAVPGAIRPDARSLRGLAPGGTGRANPIVVRSSRGPPPPDRLPETHGTRFETHGLPPAPRVGQHRGRMLEPAERTTLARFDAGRR